MKPCLLLSLAAPILLAAPGGEPEATRKDARRLQGVWKIIAAEKDGEPRDPADLDKVRLVIAGEKWTLKDPRLGTEMLTYRLGPGKKPKEIDLRDPASKEVYPGIYDLDGDNLKVCFAEPKGKRPAEFSAKAKSHRLLIVAKRLKP